MKRITDGLPVFWLVDGEYDSWCWGLLLDGGQEGKFTFTPEQLHHFFCDVCRGVNCSPNIWGNRVKMERNHEVVYTFSPHRWCAFSMSMRKILNQQTHVGIQSKTVILWNYISNFSVYLAACVWKKDSQLFTCTFFYVCIHLVYSTFSFIFIVLVISSITLYFTV